MADEVNHDLDGKEAQLRKLWQTVVAPSQTGRSVVEFVTAEPPALAEAVQNDKEVFGLAVGALRPWVAHETNGDILEATLDPGTVKRLLRLAKRLSVLLPDAQPQMDEMSRLIRQAQRKQVGEVLGREPTDSAELD